MTVKSTLSTVVYRSLQSLTPRRDDVRCCSVVRLPARLYDGNCATGQGAGGNDSIIIAFTSSARTNEPSPLQCVCAGRVYWDVSSSHGSEEITPRGSARSVTSPHRLLRFCRQENPVSAPGPGDWEEDINDPSPRVGRPRFGCLVGVAPPERDAKLFDVFRFCTQLFHYQFIRGWPPLRFGWSRVINWLEGLVLVVRR